MQDKRNLSIVVPVYNTAAYLEETFLCITNQTLGMENMEVILVNDGSMDASAEICRDFQKKYPENVRYVELLKNQGVSHAKNTALNMAVGKYITFWDSDDLWSLNAMEEAISFLQSYEEEIDMVSSNIVFFESFSRPHILNYDVTQNTIIDIRKSYQRIRTSGAACVMKTEAARQLCFDESQARWEDAKYINQLLLQKKKYGMLANVQFYYRRRKSNDSATQSFRGDKWYFLHDLKMFYNGIYEESMKQCGEWIPMMQYLMAYTIGSYFTESAAMLDREEQRQYDAVRKTILSHIEDRYLKEIPNVEVVVKWKMLSFKYDLGFEEEIDQWQQNEQKAQRNQISVARTTANYNVLKRWFALKQQNKRICTYFEKNGYERIAIYGMSDLGMYLHTELADSSIQTLYAIDRRAEKLKMGFPILTIEDFLPEVDIIIVTAVYFFKEIDEVLRNKVICPVISLEDVLYSFE